MTDRYILIAGFEYYSAARANFPQQAQARAKEILTEIKAAKSKGKAEIITFDCTSGTVAKLEILDGKPTGKWPGTDQKMGFDAPDRKKHYKPVTFENDGKRIYRDNALVPSNVGSPNFISATDVYDMVVALGEGRATRRSVKELSVFAHAFRRGAVLFNTWPWLRHRPNEKRRHEGVTYQECFKMAPYGSGARDESRDPLDLDFRYSDFPQGSSLLAGSKTAGCGNNFYLAFSDDARIQIWGCNYDKVMLRWLYLFRKHVDFGKSGATHRFHLGSSTEYLEMIKYLNKYHSHIVGRSLDKKKQVLELGVKQIKEILLLELERSFADRIVNYLDDKAMGVLDPKSSIDCFGAVPGTGTRSANGGAFVGNTAKKYARMYRDALGMPQPSLKDETGYLNFKDVPVNAP